MAHRPMRLVDQAVATVDIHDRTSGKLTTHKKNPDSSQRNWSPRFKPASSAGNPLASKGSRWASSRLAP
jgi:hypothetical protein